jgi:tetratricopeptide (TPR) repeat protein
MRKYVIYLVTLAILVAGSATAQVRGRGRLTGVVIDQATSKPVEGATVTLNMPGGAQTKPIIVKTDAKGRWAALGLVNGTWDVDIDAKGYQPTRGSAAVSEAAQVPPIKTALAPAQVVEETAPATDVAPDVAPEAVAAVRAGEELMQQQKYKEAAAEFEKALPLLPDNMQLKQVLAQAYYKSGELKKAVAQLEQIRTVEPDNSAVALLLVNLYLEDGDLDKGKTLLESLPTDFLISEPTVYLNFGILFLNKNNPAEAVKYFSKAIALDDKRHEGYYYRGLAYVQDKKSKEAKADFEKVLELAADTAEARDAKQMLANIK